MTLHIELPIEIEHAVRERALASGVDVATYVVNIVKDDVAEELVTPRKRRMSHEEFRNRIDRLIASHGIRHGHVDDSRESIYAGRGE